MQPNQKLFFDVDDAGPRHGPDSSALFFNRTAVPIPSPPMAMLMPSQVPKWMFDDPFAGVIPRVEYYSQVPAFQSNGTMLLFRGPNQVALIEPDLETRRTDHGLYFTIARHYVAQMVGFETQIPDFWDDPWQEPMPRQRNHALDLQPFRQPSITIIGQPFLLFYGQPRPPYVEAEVDPIHRGEYRGLLYIVANPPLPPVVILRVQATGIGTYDYARIQAALGLARTPDPILYGPGDVFDILAQDFSDSSVNYAGTFAGQPFYGWMKQVPPSTPLSHPDIALYDFPSMRRLVF